MTVPGAVLRRTVFFNKKRNLSVFDYVTSLRLSQRSSVHIVMVLVHDGGNGTA